MNVRTHAKRAVTWSPPVPRLNFRITQPYLAVDRHLYPEFGRHPGVDYAGGKPGIPLLAVAQGEIIYACTDGDHLGTVLGNHCALFIPRVGRSFLYCHLADAPPAAGMQFACGETLGEMGETGEALGIHLHLEGYYGRFSREVRNFVSLEDLEAKTFDADAYLRQMLRE